MPMYEEIPLYASIPRTQADWTAEFQKDTDYLALITKDDRVYSYYKFDRKTNYKSRIINSLGALEDTSIFQVLH
jgi:hypothetical protein